MPRGERWSIDPLFLLATGFPITATWARCRPWFASCWFRERLSLSMAIWAVTTTGLLLAAAGWLLQVAVAVVVEGTFSTLSLMLSFLMSSKFKYNAQCHDFVRGFCLLSLSFLRNTSTLSICWFICVLSMFPSPSFPNSGEN